MRQEHLFASCFALVPPHLVCNWWGLEHWKHLSASCFALVPPPHTPPPTFSMQLVGGTLPTMHMRTVCVKVEQKNTKQSDVTRRIAYHQNFLEGGKLVVGVASVVCVVSHRYPRFLASCKNADCWFLQILPCLGEIVQQVW